MWLGGEEYGQLEDRSATGFGIRLRRLLPPGAEIRIQLGDRSYLAIVRHCSEANGEYLIGVEHANKPLN